MIYLYFILMNNLRIFLITKTYYFFCIGLMMILAAYTLKNIWFYAPAMLLSVTAIFRVISWAAHDATFATQFIIIEIVLVAILLITSRKVSGN